MSTKPGGWPADREERIARGELVEGLPPVECAPDDPERFTWGDDGLLDGYEFRCRRHPGQEIFIAHVSGIMDPDAEEPEGGFNAGNEPDPVCFQVRKNGENTNIFEDGIVGVPKWAHEFHDFEPMDVTCARCGEYPRLFDLRRQKYRKVA